jgi:glycosyltransferase involved in cell wall biosynthesis
MKVSLLIPVYNAASTIGRTIESAMTQTWPDKEIILVDDGSTDDTLATLRAYESSQVKVITQPNAGACAARNRAFAAAQGELIQYLDADDLLSPNKLEEQVRIIQQFGKEVIASSKLEPVYPADYTGSRIRQQNFLERDWNNPVDWLINSFEGKGMNQTSIWLTPRHLVEKAGPWNEKLLVNQDGEFFCRVLLQAKAIRFAENAIVYYHAGNTGSVSGMLSFEKAASRLYSYQLCDKQVLAREDSDRVRQALIQNYLFFIYFHYDHFPQLIPQAKEQIAKLGIPSNRIPGGKYFSYLAKGIGFYNALKLRSVLRKVV